MSFPERELFLAGPWGHVLTRSVVQDRVYSHSLVYGTHGSARLRDPEDYELRCYLSVKCYRCMSQWVQDVNQETAARLTEDSSWADKMAEDMAYRDPTWWSGSVSGSRSRTCDEIRDERLVREVMES